MGSLLGGPYVLLTMDDIADSMSYFIGQCVLSHPETRQLSYQKMQTMLAGTMCELREKGPMGKAWEWGTLMYTTYAWGTYAFEMYSNPLVTKIVIKAFQSCAAPMCALLI